MRFTSKFIIPLVALCLVCTLTLDVAASALPGPPDAIGIDNTVRTWYLNGVSASASGNAQPSASVTWSNFSSLPSTADIQTRFVAYSGASSSYANFLGGQSYQFYWNGSIDATGTPSFSSLGSVSSNVTPGYQTSYTYAVSYSGSIYTCSLSGRTFRVSRDGSFLDSFSFDGTSDVGWAVTGSTLYLTGYADRDESKVRSEDVAYGSDSGQYGTLSTPTCRYDALDSITFSFPDVSGSTAGGYDFTVPASNFSYVGGEYRLNAIISIPAGTDCESYFSVHFNFSGSSSQSIENITFTVEDVSFGGMGAVDSSLGELQETNETLNQISNQLTDLASSLEGIAQESTLGQCLSAIRSIYNYLSGDVTALLNEIKTNGDTLYAFLTGNMLPTIVTQLSNIKASIDSGFNNTIAAIQAQTAAIIAYLDEAFGEAGEDLGQSGDDLGGAIGDYDDAEGNLTGDFNDAWSDFDFNDYQYSSGLTSALSWVSQQFTNVFTAMGVDAQMIIVIPAVLGVSLMLITGSVRALGRRAPRDRGGGDE